MSYSNVDLDWSLSVARNRLSLIRSHVPFARAVPVFPSGCHGGPLKGPDRRQVPPHGPLVQRRPVSRFLFRVLERADDLIRFFSLVRDPHVERSVLREPRRVLSYIDNAKQIEPLVVDLTLVQINVGFKSRRDFDVGAMTSVARVPKVPLASTSRLSPSATSKCSIIRLEFSSTSPLRYSGRRRLFPLPCRPERELEPVACLRVGATIDRKQVADHQGSILYPSSPVQQLCT